MKTEKELVILPKEKNIRPKYFFRIVVVGEAGVGKTSIINQANSTTNKNVQQQSNTVFGFSWKNYCIDGSFCRIQIWDTCGQELYHSVVRNFYKRAVLAYLVFSLDDEKSFVETGEWLKEIKENENKNMLFFLIGNKCDIVPRQVSLQQIEEFKTKNNIEYYIETSAKNFINIETLFEDTIRKLYYNFVILSPHGENESESLSQNIILTNEEYNYQELKEEKSCRLCVC